MNFLVGILCGLIVGVIAGFLFAQKRLNNEKINHILNHYITQIILMIAIFFIVTYVPNIEDNIKLILICFISGLYLLFSLRYVPKICKGSDCNDVRCDITILKLYGKLSFVFILLGGTFILFLLSEEILTKIL